MSATTPRIYRDLSLWSVALMGASLIGFYLLVALFQFSIGWIDPDLFSWAQLWEHWPGQIFTLLQLELFALCLPWLILSVHGEWLYSRALTVQEVQRGMLRSYLIWWTTGAVLLLGWLALGQALTESSPYVLSWPVGIFSLILSLGAGLVMATHGQLARWQPLGLIATALWFFIGLDWEINGFAIGFWIGLAASLLWLGSLLLQALHLNEFRGLMASIGQSETQSLGRRWLQVLPQPVSSQQIQASSSNRSLKKLALLIQPGVGLYGQIFGVIVALMAMFGLRNLLGVSQSATYQVNHLLLLSVLFMAVMVMFNPRYLMRQYQEYYFSLPVARWKLYLSQWGLQGLIILAYIPVLMLVMASAYANQVNLLHLALLAVFLWLGGELLIGLCVLILLAAQLNFLLGIGVLLVSNSPWALLLWVAVLGFRAWDLWAYSRQDLQIAGQHRWLQQFKLYALPGLLLLSMTIIATRQLPLPYYIGWARQVDSSERFMLAYQSIEAAFFSSPAEAPNAADFDDSGSKAESAKRAALLADLLQAPHDPQTVLKLATHQAELSSDLDPNLVTFIYRDRPDALPSDSAREVQQTRQMISPWLEWLPKASSPHLDLLNSRLEWLDGDKQKALGLAQQVLQQQADPVAAALVIDFQIYLFHYTAAIEQMQALAAKNQLPPGYYQIWANLLSLQGRWSEAVQLVSSAPAQASLSAEHKFRVPLYLADACESLSVEAKPSALAAEQALCQSQTFPSSASLREQGEWLIRQGKLKEALSFYQTKVDGLGSVAWLLQQQRQSQAALAAAQRAFVFEQQRLDPVGASLFRHRFVSPLDGRRAAETLFALQPTLQHARWSLLYAADATQVLRAANSLPSAEQLLLQQEAKALQHLEKSYFSELKTLPQLRNLDTAKILTQFAAHSKQAELVQAGKQLQSLLKGIKS